MRSLPTRHRRALSVLHATFPRGFLLCAGLLSGLLLTAGTAHRAGLVIGNASPSVPRGLYLRAKPDHATYVTFCLGSRHRGIWTYADLCSPETPDASRILKRIAMRHADGSLTVEGDTPRALDSRFLGPVRPEEIHGWWRPLLIRQAWAGYSGETKP